MEYLTLNNGVEMPKLGLGSFVLQIYKKQSKQ